MQKVTLLQTNTKLYLIIAKTSVFVLPIFHIQKSVN